MYPSLSLSLTYSLEHHKRAEAETLLHGPLHHSAVSADRHEGLASLHALVHPLHLELLSRKQWLLRECLILFAAIQVATGEDVRIMCLSSQQASIAFRTSLGVFLSDQKRPFVHSRPSPLLRALCARKLQRLDIQSNKYGSLARRVSIPLSASHSLGLTKYQVPHRPVLPSKEVHQGLLRIEHEAIDHGAICFATNVEYRS